MNLREHWINFIEKVLFEVPASHIEFSGHKFVDSLILTIPGKDWQKKDSGFDITELGYASKKSKFSQLKRIYYSPENISMAKTKMEDREEKDFTSVSISTLAGAKNSKSQGHCIISIIISKILSTGEVNVSVFYRNTELIRKFGADLLFLKEVVIPDILGDIPIKKISFHFANAFFSPMFLPVLIPYIVNIPAFLGSVKSLNHPRIWKACTWGLKIPILKPDPEHYQYRSRKNMHQMGINHYKNLLPEHLESIKKYIKGLVEDIE